MSKMHEPSDVTARETITSIDFQKQITYITYLSEKILISARRLEHSFTMSKLNMLTSIVQLIGEMHIFANNLTFSWYSDILF